MALTRLTPDPGLRRVGRDAVHGDGDEASSPAAWLCTPGQARGKPKPREPTPRFPDEDAQNQPGRLQGHQAVARPPQTESGLSGGHGGLATTSSTQCGATPANRQRGPRGRFKLLGSGGTVSVAPGSPRGRWGSSDVSACGSGHVLIAATAPVTPPRRTRGTARLGERRCRSCWQTQERSPGRR